MSMVESSYTVGKQDGRNEIATNLLKANILDIQTIAEMTALTVEDVTKLHESLFNK